MLKKLFRKEHLSDTEAEALLSSTDKRLFFERLTNLLKYKYLLSEEELLSLFKPEPLATTLLLPLSIFSTPSLSALESICKYLKEDKGLRYSEIASLLNRDQRTIWVTYNNACKKRKESLPISDSRYNLPISIFQDRRLSVLESIVTNLKDTYNLRYVEIASLIQRDERNIWAIYNKAVRKLK